MVQVVCDAREHLDYLDFSSVSRDHYWEDSLAVGQVEVDFQGNEEVEQGEVLMENSEVGDFVPEIVLEIEV